MQNCGQILNLCSSKMYEKIKFLTFEQLNEFNVHVVNNGVKVRGYNNKYPLPLDCFKC